MSCPTIDRVLDGPAHARRCLPSYLVNSFPTIIRPFRRPVLDSLGSRLDGFDRKTEATGGVYL